MQIIPKIVEGTSVILCTRNRPVLLRRALVAILSSKQREFHLLVVDQSDDDASKRVVEDLAANDTRIRLIPDSEAGLSRARNRGVDEAQTDILLFTDDDCEPDSEWVGVMTCALRDETLTMAYGTVLTAPFDLSRGTIWGFHIKRFRRLFGPLSKVRDSGMGANMAIRRELFTAVGGFDEYLGAGGRFGSAEDCDFAYRALRLGATVLHAPDARVTHHGFRTWQASGTLSRRTYEAIGATYMKHVRCGDIVAFLVLGHQAAIGIIEILKNLMRMRRPLGIGRFMSLFLGCKSSFGLKVNHRTALYQGTKLSSAGRSRTLRPSA